MKYIVIIGVSLGIGYEIVLVFVGCGKNFILVVCREDKLEELKRKVEELN